MNGDFMTVADFAQQIGTTERTVRASCQRGELPARKICGRWVISKNGLDASIREKEAEKGGKHGNS